MRFMHVILIIAIVIPSMTKTIKRVSYEKDPDEEEYELQSRTVTQLDKTCNWYTYELDTNGILFYDDKSYQCSGDTLVPTYCILTYSDAVSKCNKDSKCSGFAMTDLTSWHDLYDESSEVAVQLFTTSLAPKSRPGQLSRWFVWRKTCWKFSAKRQLNV
ncbi:hypothetical protein I4U23_013002 [Adineta vaga]|nr:hypothetical protein I4U23_013002 [Adineta vaga]